MRNSILLAACLVSLSAPNLEAADLEAGVAVIDITPPKGYRMSGYFRERFNTGTHDALHAKALYLRQGDTEAALVFCDLIGVSLEASRRARLMAAQQSRIPFNNILICATHSHTGPLYFGSLRDYFHEQAVAKQGKDPHEADDYSVMLPRKLIDAIDRAKKAAVPVTLSTTVAQQKGLSFSRRFHMKDGKVRFNPGKMNPNIVKPAGPIDPDVGLLRVSAKGKDDALVLLTVFALHLDTVGGTEYAADYPFYLHRSVRKVLGGDCVSMFAAGTCGDINHIDVSHRKPQKGHDEAGRIGIALGDTVVSAIPKLKAIQSPSLAVRSKRIAVPLKKYTKEQVGQAKKDFAKIGTRKLSFLEQVETYNRVSVSKYLGDKLNIEVQVFRLGDDVALVGLPGEVFVDLGLAIKKASPFSTTLVVELCNDAPGYIPTKKGFAEGSYETVNSRIQPGGGEKMVDAVVELLKELGKK